MVTHDYFENLEKRIARLKMESEWLDLEKRVAELRYNPYHDPKNGRFTSGSSLTKTVKSVRLDSKGSSFRYPTINLPKKEYADVIGEIGRLWHTKYQGKALCVLSFTDKVYYFENRGIGDYNIYAVEKK